MKNKHFTVSFEEALNIVLSSVSPLGWENISIMEANGRVLYEDIISNIMIPATDDSAMDGYAVIADNTRGASKAEPVKLEIIGERQAGGPISGKRLSKGTAIKIMTGAPIPAGADSVIPFEDTEEEAGYVKIIREVVKEENVRFAGENIKKGDIVLEKGERLKSANIGILASLNLKFIQVYRQPAVSIISTGNELAEIGDNIKPGQIINSSAYALYSEIQKYSAIPRNIGIAKDTIEDTRQKFEEALKSDVIISTGGVSMGNYDFVKDIYSDLGIEILFGRINVKPGRPTTFGKKENKMFFGLPGNPVATLSSFIQFVRPALLKLMGAKKINKPVVSAIIKEDISKQSGKVNLMRGIFTINDNQFFVSTTGNQNSSILRSMSDANCLIVLPENIENIKEGEKVLIQLIEHDEIL
jgi:molybdopterin molybdotransferase